MKQQINKHLREKGLSLLQEGLETLPEVDHATATQMEKVLERTVSNLEQVATMIGELSEQLQQKNRIQSITELPKSPTVACQGVEGAYSHIATNQVFETPQITFYQDFEDVTKAVQEGKQEFGVLPVENSTAGNVEDVIEYICKYHCYIHTVVQIRIAHCLAAAKGASLDTIHQVFSHPQALRQSSTFLKENNLTPVRVANTAIAAKQVANAHNKTDACICSTLSAELYGLDILQESIQNMDENYTRFVCISKESFVLPKADTVSIALSFPNKPGALGELLTGFSALNLDLTKIQSMPIGGADFNVRFHLDFQGNLKDKRVENLLGHMYDTYEDFQFLGNFQNL